MSMNLRPPSRRVPLNYCARRESQSGSSCVPIVLPIFFTNLFDRVYFSSLSLSAQCVLIPYFFLSCCEASSQRQYFVWFWWDSDTPRSGDAFACCGAQVRVTSFIVAVVVTDAICRSYFVSKFCPVYFRHFFPRHRFLLFFRFLYA